MDAVFVVLLAALWGLMVLLVRGFEQLERSEGGRS
jgi:hypothetical protein